MAKFSFRNEEYDLPKGGGIPSEGVHVFAVTELVTKTSAKGAPYLSGDFEIIDPDDPERGRQAKFIFFGLSEKGAKFTAEFFRAAALPGVEEIDPESQEDIDLNLRHRIVIAEVKHYEEEYQGTKRTKCRLGRWKAPTPDVLARLEDAYGSSLLPPHISTADAGYGAEDDIPF